MRRDRDAGGYSSGAYLRTRISPPRRDVSCERRSSSACQPSRALDSPKKDGISLAHTGLVADRAADMRLLQAPRRNDSRSKVRGAQRVTSHSRTQISAQCPHGAVCPRPRSWRAGRGTDQKTALMKLYDQGQGLVVNEKASDFFVMAYTK